MLCILMDAFQIPQTWQKCVDSNAKLLRTGRMLASLETCLYFVTLAIYRSIVFIEISFECALVMMTEINA